nr:unnamed protein product [Callosobruchus analis]
MKEKGTKILNKRNEGSNDQLPLINEGDEVFIKTTGRNKIRKKYTKLKVDKSKVRKRSRRGLVNGLGTIINYVTGNLDQNDLTTIQNNFHKLYNTQSRVIEQVNSQISFAHAISAKLEDNMRVIEKRLLNTHAAIREFKEKSDKHMIISRILFVANQLYGYVQSLEVSITLAMQGIPNLGTFSKNELSLIQDHLSKCAKVVGIKFENLKQCSETKGDSLQLANAKKSTSVGFPWVPFITFNDELNRDVSAEAVKDLEGLVCNYFGDKPPKGCPPPDNASIP